MPERRKALLLGMVFAKPPQRTRSRSAILGQEYRDRIRCEELEKEFDVFTLDDKHTADLAVEKRHCRANFADPRRMITTLFDTWEEGISFDCIVLDYFFLPSGWAAQRWTQKFFTETLPILVEMNIIRSGGEVWLPHVSHTAHMVHEHSKLLEETYTWELVKDPSQNPLYKATEQVVNALIKASPVAILTNDTQLPYLLQVTDEPFYKFTAIAKEFRTPKSKTLKRQKLSPVTEMRSLKRKLFEDE